MKIFPFNTVKNYSEMLLKITIFTFLFAMGSIVYLKYHISSLNNFLNEFSMEIKAFGIPIPLGVILPAFFVTFLTRIFKFHDRISDIFKIRHKFDVNKILIPMAEKLSFTIDDELINKISRNRNSLMRNVFYEYASSTTEKSAIDRHQIEMALDQWSWYWILIEAIPILLICSLILFIHEMFMPALFPLFMSVFFTFILIPLYSLCGKYAKDEVETILKDRTRQLYLKSEFNAL